MSESLLPPVPEDWDSALAIAAHPDDLEYGASCAIAKWTAAGKRVTYLMATRGEAGIDAWAPSKTGPVREHEERQAGAAVGVDRVEFLDYQDGVVEYGLPLRRDLARAIRIHKPQVLITGHFGIAWPSGGLNQADHRAVGLATLDAARDAANRWIFPELLAQGLEPWHGLRYVLVAGMTPSTHGCVIAQADLDRGIASLQAHHAYFDNLAQPFDASDFLTQAARAAGEQAGAELGVGFTLFSL
ncbi:MAG: PIG-L deacetylase family protein [Chloroflexota bacterium]